MKKALKDKIKIFLLVGLSFISSANLALANSTLIVELEFDNNKVVESHEFQDLDTNFSFNYGKLQCNVFVEPSKNEALVSFEIMKNSRMLFKSQLNVIKDKLAILK